MPGQTTTLKLPYPTPDDTVDVPRDVAALANAIDPLGVVPVGCMMMWPTAVAPGGWLLCQGQQVDAATYPQLATLLGSAAGKVTLPDYRDTFPVGAGPTMALGSAGGAASVQLSAAESGMPAHDHSGLSGNNNVPLNHQHSFTTAQAGAHSHGYWAPGNLNTANVQSGATPINRPTDAYYPQTDGGNSLHSHTGGTDAGQGNVDHRHAISAEAARNATAAHENRPPYRALNFIIRAG